MLRIPISSAPICPGHPVPHTGLRLQLSGIKTPFFFFIIYFLEGCVAGKAPSTRALKRSWSGNCMLYIYIQAGALSRARCFSPPAACQRAAAVVCSGSRVGGRRKQAHTGVTVSSSRSPQDLWLSLPAGMCLRPGCAGGDVLVGMDVMAGIRESLGVMP